MYTLTLNKTKDRQCITSKNSNLAPSKLMNNKCVTNHEVKLYLFNEGIFRYTLSQKST